LLARQVGSPGPVVRTVLPATTVWATRPRPVGPRKARTRPAPSGRSRSYQMCVSRTVRRLGRRGDACGRHPERSRGPPGWPNPIKWRAGRTC